MDTVEHVHPTLARALAAVTAAVALSVPAAVLGAAASSPAAAASSRAPASTGAPAHTRAPASGTAGTRAPATPAHTPGAANTPVRSTMANAGGSRASHVILVGIGGLRWSDISPATPTLWRLAGQGSVGSLIVHGARQDTCPAGDWLTLNAAARAAVPLTVSGTCPANPPVVAQQASGTGPDSPVLARVPVMAHLVSYNSRFSQNPQWGLLGGAPGPGRCSTAVGPGAALALATRTGTVSSYLPSATGLTRSALARCPLTVIDLGNLPQAAGPASGRTSAARSAALSSVNRRLTAIDAELPTRTILVVAGLSGGLTPHLQAVLVSGPGYRAGLLAASSTRQGGAVVITDLTPTVLRWLGAPVPSVAVGSQVRSTSRPSTAATISMLAGQDTAAGVYRSTMAPFFLVVGFGYSALFALIWAIPWGRGPARRRRRRAVARAAGVWAAAVPVGTLLAGLVPWATYADPAAVLYSLAAAWAAVVAAVALAGPWRRDPLGPAGVVAAVTLGVIALDLMTGSHLELETPFGISLLVAGRYYGLANNTVVIYAASGVLCAAWLAAMILRSERRRAALAVMAAVLAFTVAVAGWPGFGAKVGGTIAMVPGFLVLLAVTAGIRVTPRRAALIAVSGVAVVTVFALVNYFVPVTGHSDIGAFVGQSLHGGAGSILRRKIGSNLGSLAENPFVWVIPVVVAALGLMVFWPGRVRAHMLARAYEDIPLLRPALSAIWLIAVLGWFAEDSGVTVPAAALPLVLPLAVVILSSVPARRARPATVGRATAQDATVGFAGTLPATPGEVAAQANDGSALTGGDGPQGIRRAGPAADAPSGDRASPGPGQPGYR